MDLIDKLNTWPSHAELIRISAHFSKFGLGTIKKTASAKKKTLNNFRGSFISSVVEIEEKIELLLLHLISKGDNEIKLDIHDLFAESNNFGFGLKFKFFESLLKRRMPIYAKYKTQIDKINTTMRIFILLRNSLAHSYFESESFSDKSNFEYNIVGKIKSGKKVIYTDKFISETKEQLQFVCIYLEFLREQIFLNESKEFTTLFSTIIASPEHRSSNELSREEFNKLKSDFNRIFGIKFGVNIFYQKK